VGNSLLPFPTLPKGYYVLKTKLNSKFQSGRHYNEITSQSAAAYNPGVLMLLPREVT
jgi:hypothetical protein